MLIVFIKELRQFRRSQTILILYFLTILLAIASFAVSQAPYHQKFVPHLLAGGAHLTGGLFTLAVIAIAGSRWKNENGDGSIDIVRTTPISPISVACGKISAAVLFAYPAYAVASIALYAIEKRVPLTHLLITGFLQTAALYSLSLGCATFQNKKRGSFDWAMVAVILVMLPVISVIFKGFSSSIVTADFIAIDAELAAAAVFGMSLCICGSSTKCSDRAMVLKISVFAISIILPFVFKYTTKQHLSWQKLYGISLFFAAIFIITGALFERMKQSRRVLASSFSRKLFLFSTGVANSFFLYIILIVVSIILSETNGLRIWGAAAKILFYTGICQITRNPKTGNFPVMSTVIVAALVPGAAAICQKCLSSDFVWIAELFVIHKDSPVWASAIFTIAGAALYAPVCCTFFKQYFCKESSNA